MLTPATLQHTQGAVMETSLPTHSPGAFRGLIADAIRFWEVRRLIYNFALFAVVVAWVALTWPHFRPMLVPDSLLLLAILGLLSNACYCAAYLVDVPMQCSALGAIWRRWRWTLWVAGMLLRFCWRITGSWTRSIRLSANAVALRPSSRGFHVVE